MSLDLVTCYVLTCIFGVAWVWAHRHQCADTRQQLILPLLLACIPVVNVVLLALFYFIAWGWSVRIAGWLREPLK